VSSRISQKQLESYLWGAATLLRGTIDAGDYKQFIFPLLFYKRLCDVFDEETQAALKESGGDKGFAAYPENHRFQIPSEAHWRNVREAAKNVGKVLQSAMRTIETANPDKLYGIFGDAQWTNKDRLSDTMLRDLVEHFSTLELAVANLPEDELGQGYEYLIKKFADDAGHTAAEFYTNRTVVHLMTEMLKPQPAESIYDPTCGSGGMLLSCITQVRRQGQEWRNVRLYGQERNLMTSSIARMNCFLHGIEDFQIVRGDTLSEPKFVQRDRLMRFDVVLANPPYSIKQWDRDAFASDPWGRNLFGTPPQGRADYAFWQHILCSLDTKTGRCAILFPHGVLFRQEEAEMRRKLIETDTVECVLGLGPNLFYNSPMEACVVICRATKPKARKGRILLINAVNEVTRERAQSFLTDDHIERVVQVYEKFKDERGFARVVTLQEIRKEGGSLNIPLYISAPEQVSVKDGASNGNSIGESLAAWLTSASELRCEVKEILGEKHVPPNVPLMTTIGKRLPSWLKHQEWKRLAFGAFADSMNERVEPGDAAEEIYVGLDDLDSNSLHIRRWGKGSDVIGTKLRFRKGDIIFGRRRAYQRKLAVAEMGGICSAHAMVVRAKPNVVLPEFLPFLMTSDRFMNRAVEISVGSLSPTINWTTLKLEEFDLPPLDQQRCIAEVLWAVDEFVMKAGAASEDSSRVVDAQLDKFLYQNSDWRIAECRELLAEGPRNGFSPPASATSGRVPTLSISAIRGGKVVPNGSLKYADVSPDEVSQFRLQRNDILIVRGNGNRLLCGRAGVVEGVPEGCFYPDLLIRLRFPADCFLPEFAVMQWNELKTHTRLLKKAKSSNGIYKINGQDIQSHRLIVPPIVEQVRFLEKLKRKASTTFVLESSATAALNLQRSLINTLLS
jgi:type I restriction enzyme M protein